MGSPFRSRAALIVPLVLLVIALLQDIVTYKVRQHVRDPGTRALIILGLTAFGFVIAAEWIGPWLKSLLSRVRKGSQTTAGEFGIWAFYAACYGAMYWAYVIVEERGVKALLPAKWR
jgi:hypothetical protein